MLVVHDRATQVLLEVGRRGLGRPGDGTRGHEIGKQSRVTEWRRKVDQQHLLGVLGSQRSSRVHGQGADAGAALGGKERDDRRRRPSRGLGLGGCRGRHLLLPELVEGDRHLLDVGTQPLEKPIPIEREQRRRGQAADAGHVAVAGAGGGEDEEVARGRPAGQQQLACGIRDRLLGDPRGEEYHNVAAPAAKPEGVVRGELDRLHPSGQRSEHTVGELGENRRHFKDAHAELEDGRRLGRMRSARSHRLSSIPQPATFANLAGVQNADNVATSPKIAPSFSALA